MSSTSSSDRAQVISAFLSHSYGEPAVNLFFYELNSKIATITFRVDRGRFSTSTTRLERMIRDADAFVGVWPLPGEPGVSWDGEALANQSRYFRLELDMAIRAHKPGIVFADRRYGNLLQTPPEIERLTYDAQEISLSTSSPSWSLLRAKVKRCWRDRRPQLAGRPLDEPFEEGRVGVLFGRYDDVDAARVAEEAVSRRGLDPVRLPATLNIACLNELRRCDWVIADVTDPAIETMTAFLHGQFIPVMRTRRETGQAPASAVEDVLFGDLTVGYRKDVTHWSTEPGLRDGLLGRLEVITQQATLIGDQPAAIAYFSSAAKRKELVFLSYAQEDAALADQFGAALRQRFQEVFDYRDGSSLRTGEYWQDQIARKLSVTAIGVILFSEHYKRSGYCMDEGRDLIDRFVNKEARLLPVKLDGTRVPATLSKVQYARVSQLPPDQIVERFVRGLDDSTNDGSG
jgi:TIR domain